MTLEGKLEGEKRAENNRMMRGKIAVKAKEAGRNKTMNISLASTSPSNNLTLAP